MQQQPAPTPQPPPSASIKVKEEAEDTIAGRREDIRGTLAYGLLGLVFLIVGAIIFFIMNGGSDDNALTESVLPAVIALVGTALGFYFGQESVTSNQSGTPPTSGGQ